MRGIGCAGYFAEIINNRFHFRLKGSPWATLYLGESTIFRGMVTTIITFSCDVEDALEIEEYCRRHGYSRSWFIRECVMQVVDGRVPLLPRDPKPILEKASGEG